MSAKKAKKTPVALWVFLAMMIILGGAGVYVIKTVLSGESPREKSFVTVTLLKPPPPPPPPPKEKPPEPKPVVPKKEEVVTSSQPKQKSKPSGPQNKPAGPLGVVGKGTAGSDAFGLTARSGGRDVTIVGGGGGGNDRMSQLLKYAGYSQVVQNEIRKLVLKQLNDRGLKGKFQTVVSIELDPEGAVMKCIIVGSSGNDKVDETVKHTLSSFKVGEPRPQGMKQWMKISINTPS